jgi:calcium/calmodulin-dependent protein kinase I
LVQSQRAQRFSERRTAALVTGLIHVIQTMQKYGLVHRDIKLSNIALDASVAGSFKRMSSVELCSSLRLIDFGMATYVSPDGLIKGRCGTPGYCAPELLKCPVNGEYPGTVDMFSLGVVCYAMLCGYEPFQRNDTAETLRANKQCEFMFYDQPWNRISDHAKDFIRRLLTEHPQDRMTPQAALDHPWLRGRLREKAPPDSPRDEVLGNDIAVSSLGSKQNKQSATEQSDNEGGCVIS